MGNKYQVLPDLTPIEYEALKADIAENGVLVAVEVDENGDLLDGHHRVKAWKELRADGLKLPQYLSVVRPGMTEAQKRNHARRLNVNRRQLTKDQRQSVAQAMIEDRDPDVSTREAIKEAAEVTGVSERQIDRDTKDIRKKEKDERKERILELSALGWSQRQIADEIGVDAATVNRSVAKSTIVDFATPLPGIVVSGKAEQTKAIKIAADLNPGTGTVSLSNAKKQSKQKRMERRTAENAEIAQTVLSDSEPLDSLFCGDFRELANDIDSASVDLILTDPPYPREFLPLWSDLALIAKRILKPGGYLVAYSGQMFLPDIFPLLSEHLEYQWLAAVQHSNGFHRIHMHDLLNAWKPVFIYSNGKPTQKMRGLHDLISGGRGDKDAHEWAQPEAEAAVFVEAFSEVDQIVLDPFMGSGTIPAVARRMGRTPIGFEIDEDYYNAAVAKLYG